MGYRILEMTKQVLFVLSGEYKENIFVKPEVTTPDDLAFNASKMPIWGCWAIEEGLGKYLTLGDIPAYPRAGVSKIRQLTEEEKAGIIRIALDDPRVKALLMDKEYKILRLA